MTPILIGYPEPPLAAPLLEPPVPAAPLAAPPPQAART
jgi:hypothetical protein